MSLCPTTEQLDRLLHIQLEGTERDDVSAHVQDCPACQHTLERLTDSLDTPAIHPTDRPISAEDQCLLEQLKAQRPAGLHNEPGNAENVESERENAISDPSPGCGSAAGVSDLPIPAIEGFRIIREIGRGGMGTVYEAEEVVLSRRVALKVLSVNVLHRPREVERFDREAKAAARLHHTNIVPVFGVGHQVGLHYYVMQLIDGLGLDKIRNELRRQRGAAAVAHQPTASDPAGERGRHEPSDLFEFAHTPDDAAVDAARSLITGGFAPNDLLRLSPRIRDHSGQTEVIAPPATRSPVETEGASSFILPSSSDLLSHSELNRPYFRSLARIGLQVAEALEYANRQGVLHRDIKPSNLLLDTRGNTWLTDFGLAKTTESDDLTATGETLGTVRYMAPERFQGACDARSDLYGLGLTLFELIALRPAYEETDRFQLIERIRRSQPARLKTLVPRVPRDLETIVHKAIERDPARRYATAAAMADDLRRFLDGRPIHARQASTAERLARWGRRNPWVSAFLAALVLGLAVSIWQSMRAIQAEYAARLAGAATGLARDRAQEETARAKKSEAEARAVLDFFQSSMMAAARPKNLEGGLGKDVKLREAIDAAEAGIEKSFADQPAIEASIRNTLGETYYYLGEPGHALRQFERSAALRETTLGPNHPDTLESRDNLAHVHLDSGRIDQAVALLTENLKRRTETLGPEHPDTLDSLNNLAVVYQDDGQLAKAIPLYEELLTRRKEKLGLDDPSTLNAVNNLASAYRDAGRLDEAKTLFFEVLDRRQFLRGPDHPATLMSMNNLANFYREYGDYPQSLALQTKALERQKAVLGPDHPDTLLSMSNLALLHEARGDHAAALALSTETWKRRHDAFGSDHRDTLVSANNLATLYFELGQVAQALRILEDTLARRRATLPSGHPSTLRSLSNLARAYLTDQPKRAEPLLRESLAIRDKKLPDDWRTFEARSLLGASLLAQKNYSEAEILLLDGYEGMKHRESRIPAPNRKLLKEAAQRIIRLYEEMNMKDKADQWRVKAIPAG